MLIGVNLALNHLRSVRRRRQESLDETDDSVTGWLVDRTSLGPEEMAVQAEESEVFRALVRRLPEHHQEVIRMVHEAGMDIQEVAEELEISPGTVKSRLHYARAKLAKEWQNLTGKGGEE